ncbi:MAG TPA: AlpA family transcriptional regulator [Rhodocyclaceae bacterium]|nr:AlpA family transcriptional regulator [Rhodocyclaceae bacterium]HNB79236.1 AlpA family transcriptional regulator [Rhodocyclaceae bacterium]HNC61699.1 AlpA family transcriptional regulator [Rhodocyclaceae bacterium]HNH12547.1 AlpA family transcriptional regulator [Rhodocyclaceae bacterium]HNI00271.1 AlpA family transcriptional regulator [Rhodocyclaceae bacterium]
MSEALQSALERQRDAQSEQHVRLIRLREVLAKTGLSRSACYAAIQAGTFPAPIPILPGGRSTAWPEHEVDAWLRDRIAAARSTKGNAA